MQEVTQKIDELYTLLEDKIAAYEQQSQRCSELKEELVAKEAILVAKGNRLSAMERIYQKYEDFDAEKKKLEEDRKVCSEKIRDAQALEVKSNEKAKELEKKSKELDERKAVLTKQAAAQKARDAEFEEKRKELKDVISGAAVKNLLK